MAKDFGVRTMRRKPGIRIAYIPDLQVKPGVPLDHLAWIGRWIAERKPNVVIQAGDFGDMASCSTHDEPGSLAAEGRSIEEDIAVCRRALDMLHKNMGKHKCRKIITLGNHENRLARFVNAHPVLRDTYSKDPFGFEAMGWEVYPFLEPVVVAGIAFCHFFPRASSGKVMQTKNGAPNAMAMIKREMRSCVAGHAQGLDVACLTVGGRTLRGVIAGSAYLHTEGYLSPQGQGHWAGVLEMNEAADGYFDLMEVSLEYLCRSYGGGKWPR